MSKRISSSNPTNNSANISSSLQCRAAEHAEHLVKKVLEEAENVENYMRKVFDNAWNVSSNSYWI
jgi:transcription termination factor NusB